VRSDLLNNRCWLEQPDGSRISVGPAGLLIGRSARCNLILRDHRASKHHALVRFGATGPVLFPLGRNTTLLNDTALRRDRALQHGDRVGLPGMTLTVILEGTRTAGGAWMLDRGAEQALMQPNRQEYTLGGGRSDVVVPGWPEHAVQVQILQGRLLLDCAVAARLGGELVAAESVLEVPPGAALQIGEQSVSFFPVDDSEGGTTVFAEAPLPAEVRCTFLPRGGEVALRLSERWLSVQLSELRFSLLAALLQPDGLSPGDFVPDEQILPRLWPNQPGKGHVDLNLLIHRVRKNLLKAGVNPFLVLERSKNGHATRFRVEPDAQITIA